MTEPSDRPDPAWLRRLTTAEGERLPVRDLKTRTRRDRTVGHLLDPAMRRLLGRRGVALAPLLKHWPEIVGPALARHCVPHRLVLPKGASTGGTLHLKAAAGAVATELTHRAPLLCERINTHLGFQAVCAIKVAQGTMPRGMVTETRATGSALPPRPDPAVAQSLADLDRRLETVTDPELRAALARLGRAVLTGGGGRPAATKRARR